MIYDLLWHGRTNRCKENNHIELTPFKENPAMENGLEHGGPRGPTLQLWPSNNGKS